MHVLCKSLCFQFDCPKIFVILVHGSTIKKKKMCFTLILTFDDGTEICCTSEEINELGEVAHDTYTIPDESVQYWFFLFPPPPSMLFSHLSSDKR